MSRIAIRLWRQRQNRRTVRNRSETLDELFEVWWRAPEGKIPRRPASHGYTPPVRSPSHPNHFGVSPLRDRYGNVVGYQPRRPAPKQPNLLVRLWRALRGHQHEPDLVQPAGQPPKPIFPPRRR